MKHLKAFEEFLSEAVASVNLNAAGDSQNVEVTKISDNPIPLTLVDGDWEIKQLIDVSTEPPADESIIINPHLSGEPIKRGDNIYITAILNKAGGRVSNNSVGVIKARVVDIYNSLQPLNKIMKIDDQ